MYHIKLGRIKTTVRGAVLQQRNTDCCHHKKDKNAFVSAVHASKEDNVNISLQMTSDAVTADPLL